MGEGGGGNTNNNSNIFIDDATGKAPLPDYRSRPIHIRLSFSSQPTFYSLRGLYRRRDSRPWLSHSSGLIRQLLILDHFLC